MGAHPSLPPESVGCSEVSAVMQKDVWCKSQTMTYHADSAPEDAKMQSQVSLSTVMPESSPLTNTSAISSVASQISTSSSTSSREVSPQRWPQDRGVGLPKASFIWSNASLQRLPEGPLSEFLVGDEEAGTGLNSPQFSGEWRVPRASRELAAAETPEPKVQSPVRLRGPHPGPLDVPKSWQAERPLAVSNPSPCSGQDSVHLEAMYAGALERCQLERRAAEHATQEAECRLAFEREAQDSERRAWADERRALLHAFERQMLPARSGTSPQQHSPQQHSPVQLGGTIGAFGHPDEAFRWCCEQLQRQELRQRSLEAKLQYERQVRAEENSALVRMFLEQGSLAPTPDPILEPSPSPAGSTEDSLLSMSSGVKRSELLSSHSLNPTTKEELSPIRPAIPFSARTAGA